MDKQGGDSKDHERRREPRYERTVPLRVVHDGADGVKAESINISTRGLYCRSPRYVPAFAKLKVTVELPFATRDAVRVECDGVVVRVEPQAEMAGVSEYRLAVYFLNLERDSAELIGRFLAESH
ncbi:MAG: PilZ domain-containing protein [Deferrisomatales bacterium]|nr:PilZ domain-containing protein [Deferrisomatales bacterium]